MAPPEYHDEVYMVGDIDFDEAQLERSSKRRRRIVAAKKAQAYAFRRTKGPVDPENALPRRHNKLQADTPLMARPRVAAMDQGNKIARVSVRQGTFKAQVVESKADLAGVDAEQEAMKAHVKEVETFMAEQSTV
jgi:hypothetical protein